ncbi:hypothetical protein ACWGJB_28520 [Streptomyces sp. NPDC054813]
MDGSARMWISAIPSRDPDSREVIPDIDHTGGPVALPEPIGLFERQEAGVAVVAAPVPPPA